MKRHFFLAALFLACNIFLPNFSLASSYDIVLLIDDSGSMVKSDDRGRRVSVITLLRERLQGHVFRGENSGEPIDFRFSVIRFGDRARLFRDWEDFRRGKKTSPNEIYKVDNMGWTDFGRAMSLVQQQFKEIQYGRDRSNSRKLVLIVVTDGVPSTRDDVYKGVPGKGPNSDAFWKEMKEVMEDIRSNANKVPDSNGGLKQPAFSQYMIVMHDPETEEGQDLRMVLPKWKEVGFKNNIFTLKSTAENRGLFTSLHSIMKSILKGSGASTYLEAEKNGTFHIPCFQEKLFLEASLYPEKPSSSPNVRLRSPSKTYGGDGSDFWNKSGVTLLNSQKISPEAGEWKIIDYREDIPQLTLRFLPVSYQMNSVYPPKDNILLPVPEYLRFSIDLKNMSAAQGKSTCELSGSMIFDANRDGKFSEGEKVELDVEADLPNKKINVKSVAPFMPPKNVDSIPMKITLESKLKGESPDKKRSFFETHWKELTISDKDPVEMQVTASRGEITGNSGKMKLRLKLVDFRDKNKPFAPSDVFIAPNKSIEVMLECPKCEQEIVDSIPLQLMDGSATLGADVPLHRKGQLGTGFWRRLVGEEMSVKVTWKQADGMKVKENIILLQPGVGEQK